MEASILPSSYRPFLLRKPLKSYPKISKILNASSNKQQQETTQENKDKEDSAIGSQPEAVKTLNIRYRARSKRQARKQEGRIESKPKPPKKEWEEMSVAEKAMELYVGEKGLLFWLNKSAYASIFIIIGGWILFRFVGPSLGLYQLDAPPLSPTNILKGSS